MRVSCLLLVALPCLAATTTPNPLLDRSLPIPFDRVGADHVAPAAKILLEQARQQRDAYLAATGPLTFENTILALDEIGDDLDAAMDIARHLDGVASSADLRRANAEVLPLLTAFRNEVSLDPRLWARIKQYAAGDEARTLTGNRQRLLKQTLQRFKRAGADLDEAGKKRLRELNIELATLGKKFNDNALESTNAFDLVVTDEARLAGLPDSARRAAREAAKEKGVEGWRFTLQQPSMTPVLTFLDDTAIREQIYRARNAVATSGANDNRPLIARILELRAARARLLGYADFADYQTEDRMAGSGRRVREFLTDLERKTVPAFEREQAELAAFRRSLEGDQAPPIAPWDLGYYAEKLRQRRYDFDEEALRPYFPFEPVMTGLFGLVERIYGLKIREVPGAPVWHPTVKYYEIQDPERGHLGYFYTDFFARKNKRAGAWAGGLVSRRDGAKPRPQVSVIVGNMTPPQPDRPALLTHREVETIFHEFGHLMHAMLLRVPEPGLRRTVWDFVELPSQIMENFLWERECLDLFARHYQTGEPLPAALFERLVRARTFRAATAQMRQLGFATMDLDLHTSYQPARDGEPVGYARGILQRFTPAPLAADFAMPASFLHVFAGGYAAGYYSYKWAEVLEADAFSRFKQEGIFSRKTGTDFRRAILEPGNTADAAELFRRFMGRDPDPSALLRRLGLVN